MSKLLGTRARGVARWSVVSGTVVAMAAWALLPTGAALAESDSTGLEEMGQYPAGAYVDEAAALPSELVAAIDRDLGLTAEDYLAQADAAHQAVEVVDSIEDSGVHVLGSSIDGTTLVVHIENPADAAAVESTGAVAVIGEPEPFVLQGEPTLTADLWGGQGYLWGDSSSDYQCSVGFNGYVTATGARQLVTAGHCLEGSAGIVGSVNVHNQPSPGLFNGTAGAVIGAPVAASIRNYDTHPGYDVGRIAVSNGSLVAQPGVISWGGGAGAPLASAPNAITGKAAAIVGTALCRSGSRTGWRCGPVVDVDYNDADYEDGVLDINTVVAEVCSLPGDSGGAAIIGSNAVGISSWTTASGSTCAGTIYSGFFQMVSPGGFESVTTAYPEWEIAATVRTPVITNPGAANPTTIQGTLANTSNLHSVSLYLDGSSTAFGTVSAASGTWSFNVAGVANGLHTYRIVAKYGTWSTSAAAVGTFSKGVTVNRLSGADRFQTGIEVAEAGYDGPVPVLYVTTGLNYPDALSAGPASVHLGGPVLLVQPDGISSQVRDSMVALDPARVVILGSTSSISAVVYNQVVAALPDATVERIEGPDRYTTGRALNRDAFLNSDTDPGGAVSAFIANGSNFPDALSAGGAAATFDGPVILVYGAAATVPPETVELIQDLGVTNLYIAGASVSVSDGIFAQLDALPGVTATRLSGPDRFATSVAINKAFFVSPEARAVLATGLNYPDALAGSSLAGAVDAPLYITVPECILPATYDELVRLKVTTVTLLGGPPALSAGVAALKRC